MSRAPMTPEQRRREQICALMTEEEKRKFCLAANKKGLQPSVYARMVLLEAVETVAA